ncbi:MAG: maleylpyruvate isomerase N-terminal domain-containing protein [Acidimicrobiales bacterium]|jgi:uncharacterized protein (TIGR03083 family)
MPTTDLGVDDAGPQGSDAPQADHIRFLFDPAHTLALLIGHRRRFGATVAALTDEELAALSRCRGWTVADVLRHDVWVDATIRRIWSGDGATLRGFDPRVTPDESVRADRAVPDREVVARYLSSTEAMITELERVDPARYGDPSRSPAGRVPWWLSAVHVGWDSTIHERDVLVPLGRTVEEQSGEAPVWLAYSLVLASFFEPGRFDVAVGGVRLRRGDGPVTVCLSEPQATSQGTTHGTAGRAIDGTTPQPTILRGDPVAVVDAVSGRVPLGAALHGDPSDVERLGGLARYFGEAG